MQLIDLQLVSGDSYSMWNWVLSYQFYQCSDCSLFNLRNSSISNLFIIDSAWLVIMDQL